MGAVKTLHNKWPCCNAPTGLHMDHYKDGDEIERECKTCRIVYVIRFTTVIVKEYLPPFLKLNFERKTVDA